MTQPAPDQQAVVAVYQQQTTAARDQLAALIAALWLALPDWRNRSIREFTAQAVPLVEGAMGHMQALTAAYLATVLGADGGTSTPAAAASLTVASVRNGTAGADVYERPFHTVWSALADGRSITEAVDAGKARAVQAALTDVQLAKTHTSRAVLAGDRRVAGYRRVLEGPHSCALCVVASTRFYKKHDLMPMHPACDCSVDPIRVGQDFDAALNPDVLAAAHASISDRFGADSTAAREIAGAAKDNGNPVLYRDVLITHEHGELGPILAVRGQAFRGPAQVSR